MLRQVTSKNWNNNLGFNQTIASLNIDIRLK